MDPPISDVNLDQNKVEAVKDGGALFCCDHFDGEVVHKIAQLLLPGLATACVDNTTGDLFKGPASVAVDIRKEMVDYLQQRSESFVAESVIQDGESDAPEHPTEIISDFIDDFVGLKHNLFSRVSGWILSEKREDKIDDFAQELELNAFWSMDRTKTIAETLLKNIDFGNIYHCELKFNAPEELAEHKSICKFRLLSCANKGCSVTFCTVHAEKHDAVCPYKVLRCEQKCEKVLLRREMDRHCITVCPMKLINCPFYQVGCQSSFPQCEIEQHCSEFLNSHLLCVLQVTHKQEASLDELKQQVLLLEKSLSLAQRSEALDVRSLTLAIKEQEAKMKALQVDVGKASRKSIEAARVSSEVSELRHQVESLHERVNNESHS